MGDLKGWSNSLAALQPKQGRPALVIETGTGQNVNTIPSSTVPFGFQYIFFFFTFGAFKVLLINYLTKVDSKK